MTDWTQHEAERTIQRLTPNIDTILTDPAEREPFLRRLYTHFPRVFRLLYQVYGQQYDFFYYLQRLIEGMAHMQASRPADLQRLDTEREAAPLWFQREQQMGAVCYVDLFAGDLAGMRSRLPYLQELGITYLHLMPLFAVPDGDSDGGYAVSDYRTVNPALGTMTQLADLSAELRQQGISLVLDFVFNHTSDQHAWAQQAAAGDPEYQAYYCLFDDRTLPDQYEQHLREIFPQQAPGSFTYRPDMQKWVWTTFHSYQWDLNYANPAVFCAMLDEMLFLANQGVEVLRLDAVAFIWKEMGTACENLPQAHTLIQAFNACVRIVAPAMIFKSEAIVHPDNVASYISFDECPISYNPTMMALTWEALATREVKLLRHAMQKRFAIDPDCAWVNYVRVHDDIGWSFADEDAAELWINGYDHRQFLNRFYTGRFAGSFAQGLPFNYNPVNQDMRISGTAASLAGLEQGLEADNPLLIDNAVRRLIMIHSLIISAGGIPLLYLGDEIATLNDYSYEQDPDKHDDSRWVHRPRFDWSRAAQRTDPQTIPGRVFGALQDMVRIRQQTPAFAGSETRFADVGSPHVLAYVRSGVVLVLCNFSDHAQQINIGQLPPAWKPGGPVIDLLTRQPVSLTDPVPLQPYGVLWLSPA